MVTIFNDEKSGQFAPFMFLAILAVLLALAAPDRAKAQARKLELADLQKVVKVSTPAISPDGKSIVIVVTRENWEEDRHDRQLVLVDLAAGAQRPLTGVREGLGSPQWSPSGDRLAFLAETGEGKNAAEQIFVLPMNGGEPQAITSAPMGVEQFAWRPDGAFIAIVSPDEPPNKAEIEKHQRIDCGCGSDVFRMVASPFDLSVHSAMCSVYGRNCIGLPPGGCPDVPRSSTQPLVHRGSQLSRPNAGWANHFSPPCLYTD